MEISGLGDYARKISKENFEKIKQYFIDNPDATQMDCSNDLGIGYVTVLKHVKVLRDDK